MDTTWDLPVDSANKPCPTDTDRGRRRVIIENVKPEIGCGRFAAKRIAGERMTVEADIFADGHDALGVVLRYRKEGSAQWAECAMEPLVNDRWRGTFDLPEIGNYRYTLHAWVDRFKSWRENFTKKIAAGQELALDRLAGAEIIETAVNNATGPEREALRRSAEALRSNNDEHAGPALDEQLDTLMAKYGPRRWITAYDKELRVTVERGRAGFSSWYELFPRSCAREPGAHGTLRDCAERLPYVADMGFDVLYLPPIHPIGHSFRKGKNNTLSAAPDDVGSPWAIGSEEGGHMAIHPQLGTLDDLQHLIQAAKKLGIEIALDLAFQCTPDHPYARAHPEWFRKRPDGSIQYAENPPKKYQDIYPLDFESAQWKELWHELRAVTLFWCAQGVRIFRVDNPHTKPFAFWAWLIAEVKRDHPDVIFLAEAFTRPKVMYRLGKLGFSQSYSYFAWRNTKAEITDYFTELTQSEVADFFRPNLWPNTPDILTEYLQFGGRPAFAARLILAATLGANYGIYGPAFELCENTAREPGSEEYVNSEKYEIKRWDFARADSLKELIARVNRIRRENKALQSDRSLRFHAVDNSQIICFSKSTADLENVMVVAVNLDPYHPQAGWIELPLEELGIEPRQPFQMHDLLTHAHYLWQGTRNYVLLDPQSVPAQIFRVRHRLRREQDFDYFM